MPAKKISQVTKAYGFNIYPSIRKMQIELAGHYNMSATKVVSELIEEDHKKVFGDKDYGTS